MTRRQHPTCRIHSCALLLMVLFPALFLACAEKPTEPSYFGQQDTPYSPLLLSFAVIGDRTGGMEPGVYEQTIHQVQRYSPDVAVTVGDMIEGYTTDTVSIKRQWEKYLELLDPLTMPVYFTPGNHDIWNTVSFEFYERYMGQPPHSFTVNSVHMVCLDNSRYFDEKTFPKEQIDWLVADLEKHSDALQTIVFMHIPYWDSTTAQGDPDSLHQIFVKYGVDAVFTGHLHKHLFGVYDGVTYVGVGSSGSGYHVQGDFHFVWVTARAYSLSMMLIVVGSRLSLDPNGLDGLAFFDATNPIYPP